MPDFMPYLSILDINDLKLRNWCMVYVHTTRISPQLSMVFKDTAGSTGAKQEQRLGPLQA